MNIENPCNSIEAVLSQYPTTKNITIYVIGPIPITNNISTNKHISFVGLNEESSIVFNNTGSLNFVPDLQSIKITGNSNQTLFNNQLNSAIWSNVTFTNLNAESITSVSNINIENSNFEYVSCSIICMNIDGETKLNNVVGNWFKAKGVFKCNGNTIINLSNFQNNLISSSIFWFNDNYIITNSEFINNNQNFYVECVNNNTNSYIIDNSIICNSNNLITSNCNNNNSSVIINGGYSINNADQISVIFNGTQSCSTINMTNNFTGKKFYLF